MVQDDKVRWVRLGKLIRSHRHRAGLSLEEAAERISVSPTMLSAMERGKRGIKRDHMVRLDTALGTGGVLADAWDNSSRSGLPAWYQKAAERERVSTEIRAYQPLVFPGLLQTPEYARTLFRVGLPHDTPAEIDQLVQARMERQSRLREERPPRLLVVLDETVLRRPIGGRETMKGQVSHLLEASESPYVSVQVIPFDTELHPGLSNAFTLFTVPDTGVILYVETRRQGAPTDEETLVDDYSRLFSDLRGVALPEAASRRLIEKIRGEFE